MLLLVHLGLYVNFFKSELYVTRCLCFSRTVLDMIDIFCIPTKWLSSWHFLHLRYNVSQSLRSCLLGKANFYANEHAQLCCLSHVIQRETSGLYHCPAHLFCSFYFFFFSFVAPLEIVSFSTASGSLVALSSWCGYCNGCHVQSLDLLFSGYGLPLSFCATWLCSLCDSFIALQEL